jgi:hypothetical protein
MATRYQAHELPECIEDVRRRLQYLLQTLHQHDNPKQDEAYTLLKGNLAELERLWATKFPAPGRKPIHPRGISRYND